MHGGVVFLFYAPYNYYLVQKSLCCPYEEIVVSLVELAPFNFQKKNFFFKKGGGAVKHAYLQSKTDCH